MTQFPADLHPDLLARFANGGGALSKKMGIELDILGADYSVARMPVEGNTQVVGILHGGAHVVLGESLGSLSSAIHGGPDHIAVGIEINASHSKSVDSGWVTGTCRAISLGRLPTTETSPT